MVREENQKSLFFSFSPGEKFVVVHFKMMRIILMFALGFHNCFFCCANACFYSFLNAANPGESWRKAMRD